MIKYLVIIGAVALVRGQVVDPGPQPPCPSDNSIEAYFATNDCTKYWQCAHGAPVLKPCGAGTHWSQELLTCDHIVNAKCTGEGWSTTTTLAPTTTTTASPSTTTTTLAPSTTSGPIAPGVCPPVDGEDSVYFPDPNCTIFWQCSNGVPYKHTCPDGLHFNPVLNVCDWPYRAGCAGASTVSPPTSDSPGVCPPVDGEDSVYFPDPNCTIFWQCSNGVPHKHTCPDGLHFNPILNVCDWPYSAGCPGASTVAPPTSESTVSTTTTTASTPTTTTTVAPSTTTTTVAPSTTAIPLPTCKPSRTECTCTCVPVPEEPTTTECPTTTTTAAPDDGCATSSSEAPKTTTTTTTIRPPTTSTSTPSATTTSTAPTTTTSTPPTTTTPPPSGTDCDRLSSLCPAVDGAFPVYIALANCSAFCQCSNGRAYYHPCPAGLHFNPSLNVCDYRDSAGCTGEDGTTPSTASSPIPTSTTTTIRPPTTTTSTPPSSGTDCDRLSSLCPAVDGAFPVYIALANCSAFCQCSNGRVLYHPCPADLHFNPTLNVCDYRDRAGCTGVDGTTPSPASLIKLNSDSQQHQKQDDSLRGNIDRFFGNMFR